LPCSTPRKSARAVWDIDHTAARRALPFRRRERPDSLPQRLADRPPAVGADLSEHTNLLLYRAHRDERAVGGRLHLLGPMEKASSQFHEKVLELRRDEMCTKCVGFWSTQRDVPARVAYGRPRTSLFLTAPSIVLKSNPPSPDGLHRIAVITCLHWISRKAHWLARRGS
jgi:hypothetical protein